MLYLAYDAGEFRSVDKLHPGECRKIPGVPGAEDITLHPDWEVALVSSFDRRAAMEAMCDRVAYTPGRWTARWSRRSI